MLTNLRTIHRPATLEAAAELLARPRVYPLYGSGASLIRLGFSDVEEVVDIRPLITRESGVDADGDLHLGPGSALESICVELNATDSKLGSGLSAVIREEVPETLRNALTLGDALLEHNVCSLLLTMLGGLHTDFRVFDVFSRDHITLRIRDWFSLSSAERRGMVVLKVQCREYTSYRYAFEKLARTPSDTPILAVVAFAHPDDGGRSAFAYVGGLVDHPAHYVDGMQGTFDDYKGSAEYRTHMAKTLSDRALARVMDLVK